MGQLVGRPVARALDGCEVLLYGGVVMFLLGEAEMGNGRGSALVRWAGGVIGAALLATTVTACPPTDGGGGGTTTTSPPAPTQTISVGGRSATISVPDGQLLSLTTVPTGSVPATPAGLSFPMGALAVTVTGMTPGAVTTLTVELSFEASTVRKLVNGSWDAFADDGTTGAVISPDGRTVAISVQDGGRGDDDGVADGSIDDPFAPAIPLVTVTTLAGTGELGYTDGPGNVAKFNTPGHAATDAAGNLYLADALLNVIRKVEPDGTTSTYAGDGGQGLVDGPRATARFNMPTAVAIADDGTMYVSDSWNNRLRAISPAGDVTTVAGSGPTTIKDLSGPESTLYVDGPAASAVLTQPLGLIVDDAGDVYFVEPSIRRLRKLSGGVVSTVAGSGPIFGETTVADGPAAAARFRQPIDLVMDGDGVIYISESEGRIRSVTPGGLVSTVAGDGTYGYADGPAGTAKFNNPRGLDLDADGNVVVADTDNHRIRRIAAGQVTTIAGTGPTGGSTGGFLDGPTATARFANPTDVVLTPDGSVVVIDAGNARIRRISG